MKQYSIKISRYSFSKSTVITGTIEELIENFSYTLESGKSYENEYGNKKINLKPKTIKSLVTNLNNAANNVAKNGCSDFHYSQVDK